MNDFDFDDSSKSENAHGVVYDIIALMYFLCAFLLGFIVGRITL